MSSHYQILLLGDYRQSIAAVRSLRRNGHAVFIAAETRAASAASRDCAGQFVHPALKDQFGFIEWLKGIARTLPGVIVLPLGDDYVQLLSNVAMPADLRIAMPNPPCASICLDKQALLAAATDVGLSVTQSVLVANRAELERVERILQPPFVIKPCASDQHFTKRKAFIIEKAADLPYEKLGRFYPLIVQPFYGGVRHNCMFGARAGEIELYFEQRVLRTDRIDGTGNGVFTTVIRNSHLFEDVCRLVRALEYDGVGCLQFLVSPSRHVVLELNPRLDANVHHAIALGYDFPGYAISRFTGEAVGRQTATQLKSGHTMHWALGELRGIVRDILNRECPSPARRLRRLFTDLITADCHCTWSWRDPLPYLAMLKLSALSLLRRGKEERPPARAIDPGPLHTEPSALRY